MPRRHFQADLARASEGVPIAGISDVQNGNDDGEFTFLCDAEGLKLRISALIPELSEYPSNHQCLIYGADNVSTHVAAALDDISDDAAGMTILQILELVSRRLDSTDSDGDRQMLDSQEFEDFDADDDDAEDEFFPGDEDLLTRPTFSNSFKSAPGSGHTEATVAFRQRIRNDLMIAKSEGFKVGHQGGLMDGLACYVSLSIRISKLGISEEAMQAWQVKPSEYLVTIFHYPNGYKSMDDLNSYDAQQAKHNFAMRTGICTTYKPTMTEAISAFTSLSKDHAPRSGSSQQTASQQDSTTVTGFRKSFISRPLDELLDHRFHMLLKYRYSGMPWHGAEAMFNDQVSNATHSKTAGSHDKYYEQENISTDWPKVVTEDHILSSYNQPHSLPLVGMQFVLRHFVRCTEFCLICFSQMAEDLQAIKPYVCDNPLCLYQYMSLGFGPSIEHEILSQSKVVDLLVSFCYASARLGRLRDFPTGLSLAVPPPLAIDKDYPVASRPPHPYRQISAPKPVANTMPTYQLAITTKYNAATNELLFLEKSSPCPVVNGNWIILRVDGSVGSGLHFRVLDTSLYPSVKLSNPVSPTLAEFPTDPYAPNGHAPHIQPAKKAKEPQAPANEFKSASFHIYNQNFDDLTDQEKRNAIVALLDLLPSVLEMKRFLHLKGRDSLNAWYDRIPPAGLGLLRWIIASNRACILQVDHDDDATNGRKAEDRLYGMAGWVQFRFAMGTPDKERKFIQAVRATTDRLALQYPTLFAWHGSPIQNWHSIIREGLHFDETAHGRAYGHGVYHAPDVSTSLSYSSFGHNICSWPRSDLQVQQALALNEIVNAPAEYVSQSPHYVVAQLDWIQTRYLFVKTKGDFTNAPVDPGTKPIECVEQDPSRTPRGVDGNLFIPIHAIAASRRPKAKATTVGRQHFQVDIHLLKPVQKHKRQKATGKTLYDPIEIADDDDAASVATLEEDLEILELEDAHTVVQHAQQSQSSLSTLNSVKGDKGKSKLGSLASSFGSKLFSSKSSKSLTDYVPGTLDYSTLPMLAMPAWATTAATKCLMKDFKELLHVQNNEPQHELGWHIDEDKIDNIYQWIVELHSFEHTLPLAKDLKQKGLKSVVLELRFGKDYPMSPPFVRVIRPRFLGFQQGGGGHVTAGGAMCMQLLTNDGWSAASSIESVLVQVRMAMSSIDPKPARLQSGGTMDYGVGEAVDAYIRACAVHGWTVPPGFQEMVYGIKPNGGGPHTPF
ncbi:hypothetical protein IQ07DRAFT_597952 [Pyrenochaeta sp. DS3sAY3a]|nr:hypothetical protein IQ07DRAFT_597952 [Pyrenochaeta sp. DS3sAY3a]